MDSVVLTVLTNVIDGTVLTNVLDGTVLTNVLDGTSEADAIDNVSRTHEKKVLHCYNCEFKTKNKYLLSRHFTTYHFREKQLRKFPQFTCPLCETVIISRASMIHHYNSEHGIDTREEILIFDDNASFEKWKVGVEKAERFKFVPSAGPKNQKNNFVKYYRCYPNWVSKKNGHLRSESGEPLKIKVVCPCSIKAVEDEESGVVWVTFIRTHVGHEEDFGREDIPKGEKPDKIRRHLSSKKESNVVENEFMQGNDRIGVEAWIKAMYEDNSDIVRLYKPQGEELLSHPELLTEDMVLIISSDAQIAMLKKYGSNVLCIDGTDGCKLELTTLMVLDDGRQGFPCVFMFSNRMDEQTVTILAEIVKTTMQEPLETNVMMSNMSDTCVKGWLAVMPAPKHVLYSSWYVDKGWKSNLYKIRSQKKRAEVHQQLKSMMFETDEVEFELKLQWCFITLDRNPLTAEFGEFFRNTYAWNCKLWAHSYRKNYGINSRTFLENMHEAVEYIYFKGKRTKRLEKTIPALLRLTRGDFFDELVGLTPGQLKHKILDIRAQHQTSLSMDGTVVACEDGWTISQSGEYDCLVRETEAKNCVCDFKCDGCQICIHSFKCNCIDFVVQERFCKHIHKVCAYREAAKLAPVPVVDDDSFDMNELFVFHSNTQRNNVEDVISEAVKENNVEDVTNEQVKENLVSENNLNTKISNFRREVDEILEHVRCDEHVEMLLNAIRPVLHAIQAHDDHTSNSSESLVKKPEEPEQ